MTSTLLAALLAAPVLACPGGPGHPGAHCAAGGGLGGAALLAAVAALGWAVLRYAYKESGTVKLAGQAAGWILLVGGLAGFLCGALCHAFSKRGGGSHCDTSRAMGLAPSPDMPKAPLLPPGHPPLGEPKGERSK